MHIQSTLQGKEWLLHWSFLQVHVHLGKIIHVNKTLKDSACYTKWLYRHVGSCVLQICLKDGARSIKSERGRFGKTRFGKTRNEP